MDVAREAGVSAVTVGMALRDDARITFKTRHRVKTAAKRMNYRPRASAASLASGRTHSIGVIIARAPVNFDQAVIAFAPALHRLGDLLAERDFVMVLSTWTDPERGAPIEPTDLPRVFRESGIEGAIVYRAPFRPDLEQTLRAQNLPYVMIDAMAAPDRNVVAIDEHRGMELAVEHLVGLGHQRIAYLGAIPDGLRDEPSTSPRPFAYEAGYEAAMTRAGLDPREVWDHNGERADYLKRIVFRNNPVTAIITYDDLEALKVMGWLLKQGLSVPNDLSIVTLRDRADVDVLLQHSVVFPTLTAKASMLEDMATRASTKLLDLIESPEQPEPSELILLEPQLIIRQSTGPPP